MNGASTATGQERPSRSDPFERPQASTLLAAGLGLVLLAGAGLSVGGSDRTPLVAAQVLALVLYAVAAFCAPTATLPSLLFLLYTRLSDYIWPADWRLSLSQIVVALTVAGLIRQRGLAWGFRARDPLILGLLAYAGAMLLSAPTSLNPIGTLAEVVAYLRNVLIVIVIGSLIENGAALRRAIWALVAGAALLALLAWLNVATGAELSGLATSQIQCELTSCGSRFDGPAGIDNNYFAQLLLTAVPLALTISSTSLPIGFRLAALAATLLLNSVVLGTFSRGGYIGLLAVLGWMVWRARQVRRQLIVGTMVLILMVAAPPLITQIRIGYIVDRLAGREVPTGDSQNERSRLALVGLAMLLDHPLTGVGKGSYLAAFPNYAPRVFPGLPIRPLFAHNLPIQIGAETGLVGLTAFVGTIIVALRRLQGTSRLLAAAGRTDSARLVGAVQIAIGGFLVGGLFLGDNVYLRYLWLLVGLAAAAPRLVGPAPAERSSSRSTEA